MLRRRIYTHISAISQAGRPAAGINNQLLGKRESKGLFNKHTIPLPFYRGIFMKKTLSLLIVFAFLIALCGCTGRTKETTGPISDISQTAEAVTESVSETDTEIESGTDEDKSETVSEEGTVTERQTEKSRDNSSKNEPSTSQNNKSEKTETRKAGKQETTKKAKEESKTKPSTTAGHKDPETTTKKSTVTCYISVECKKINDRIDKFDDDPSKVPSDGYILKRNILTVYDLLKAACAANGVSLHGKNTMYGKYISGIGDIDEKECGAYSGWLYSVNGTSPAKSVDKYVLSDYDEIVFSYTC